MVQSLGKRTTVWSWRSVPKLTPLATISEDRFWSEGCGSTHFRSVQGAVSRRDSALYSLLRRYCTTSNCSGPTAARSVEPGGAWLAEKDWTTPSCSNCSRPARYFLASPEFGLVM